MTYLSALEADMLGFDSQVCHLLAVTTGSHLVHILTHTLFCIYGLMIISHSNCSFTCLFPGTQTNPVSQAYSSVLCPI